jgi:lysozyme family protein
MENGMALTPAQTRQGYLNLWASMSILAGRRPAINALVAKLAAGRARYEVVEKETSVPWWFIAIVHMRESSCNFRTYLGNGEPLSRRTQLVPAGRGPFDTWEEGAIDALHLQGYTGMDDWDLPTALFRFEAYNGWGYSNKGVNSPYVWAWTSKQQPGKYVSDGKWSSTAIDSQPGCAAMLRGLIDAGEAIVPDAPWAPVPTMTTAKAITTSPTVGAATIGAGAAAVQAGSGIWSWITDAGQQITAAQGASGPFAALFKALHINMENVTLVIIIGALVFVGVRHILQKREGRIP